MWLQIVLTFAFNWWAVSSSLNSGTCGCKSLIKNMNIENVINSFWKDSQS